MSLFGALSVGRSALTAEQAALQVTGNNIANAGTPGYTRQVVNFAPTGDEQVTSNQSTGSGVGITSIERQVNEALNENLRDATSDQNASQTLNSTLTQLQTTFGALNSNDLSSQLSSFFNGFSTLATNPTNSTLRSQVLQSGTSIAQYLNGLQSQVASIQQTTNAQIGTLTTQANSLLKQVATLNQQIGSAGNSGVNSLQDERDQALTQLSQLVNITAIPQANGEVNVMMGSIPVVDGASNRGLTIKNGLDPSGQLAVSQVVFADTGDPASVSGGQIGGLINGRDNYVQPAMSTIDTIAAGLINSVNTISSQGQGLAGFSQVTGTTQVLDSSLPLNASQTGIAFPPTNGTFNLYITDSSSTPPAVTTKQINVNLSGQGTQTTMASLAAAITAAGGGVVSATAPATGTPGFLSIKSSDPKVTFGFGSDTSGALAALGVNTFFTGSDASNIAVNSTIQNNTDLLATGRYNADGSTDSQANAKLLSGVGTATQSLLGGQGLNDYYTNYIGGLATQAQNVANDLTANTTIQSTLTAQQQSVSGVSMDEETVNMMQYQRAFEGSAKYINVVNQMMQVVLTLVQ